MSKFSIFSPSGLKKSLRLRQADPFKGGSASYLLRVKSKLGLGWVRSGPISTIITKEHFSLGSQGEQSGKELDFYPSNPGSPPARVSTTHTKKRKDHQKPPSVPFMT